MNCLASKPCSCDLIGLSTAHRIPPQFFQPLCVIMILLLPLISQILKVHLCCMLLLSDLTPNLSQFTYIKMTNLGQWASLQGEHLLFYDYYRKLVCPSHGILTYTEIQVRRSHLHGREWQNITSCLYINRFSN